MSLKMGYVKSIKGFKVLYLNGRSAVSHLEEIECDLLDDNFDIVILGETWLHASIADSLVSFENYC